MDTTASRCSSIVFGRLSTLQRVLFLLMVLAALTGNGLFLNYVIRKSIWSASHPVTVLSVQSTDCFPSFIVLGQGSTATPETCPYTINCTALYWNGTKVEISTTLSSIGVTYVNLTNQQP